MSVCAYKNSSGPGVVCDGSAGQCFRNRKNGGLGVVCDGSAGQYNIIFFVGGAYMWYCVFFVNSNTMPPMAID